MTVPQAIIMDGSHMEGRNFFSSRLDGISKAQYVKKNTIAKLNQLLCLENWGVVCK